VNKITEKLKIKKKNWHTFNKKKNKARYQIKKKLKKNCLIGEF
jgi:hypothetical protein